MDARSERYSSAVSALGLFAIGLLFATVLVANNQDSAYIGLWMIGGALVVSGVPYVLAAAVPAGGVRRRVLIGAVAFSALVGVLGLVILILSLVVIPSQDYADGGPLLRNHVIGLVVLAV